MWAQRLAAWAGGQSWKGVVPGWGVNPPGLLSTRPAASGEGSASAAGGSPPPPAPAHGGHFPGEGQDTWKERRSQARCPDPAYLGEQALGGGRAAGFILDAVVDLGLAVL